MSHTRTSIVPFPKKRFVKLATLDSEGFVAFESPNVEKIIEFLEKKPEKINSIGSLGTPLHILIANEVEEMACKIIEKNRAFELKANKQYLDLKKIDCENKTLLILAAKARQLQFIASLCNLYSGRVKEIINFKDEAGKTAAHYLAAYGDLEALKMLIKCGADLTLKDKYGFNIYDCSFFPEIEIRFILESIEIHPDRSRSAKGNRISIQNNCKKEIRLSPDLVKKIKEEIYKKGDVVLIQLMEQLENNLISEYLLATQENVEILKQLNKIGLKFQFAASDDVDELSVIELDSCSLIDNCLRNQKKVRLYLKNLKCSSVLEEKTEKDKAVEEVCWIDDETQKEIHSYKITQKNNQFDLTNLNLLFNLGKMNGNKIEFKKSWLNQISEVNKLSESGSNGIKTLATLCEVDENAFRKEMKL